MTVTYSLHVSKARLCGFAKLLMRWKGSIYKLLYREMLIFCCMYYGLLTLYHLVLNELQRSVFEKLAIYCNAFTELIPLSFVLGFYVTIVVGRWWQQFLAIPWPDKTCMLISTYIHGSDERGQMIRRTLARYLNLMSALTFQAVSPAVKKRFPTLDHLEEAGLMTKEEHKVYDKIPMTHGKWWVPAQWFSCLASRAHREDRIKDYVLLKHLLDEMHQFRGNCGLLFSYDWISIPLVYTQVVTLAIYTYFLAAVMGRQYLDPDKGYPGHDINLYVPVFTILQFFFYMGWLKVAEQLINPFGEDDDDFELNWCLDRNLQFSYTVVDEMQGKHPRLVRDMYWDESEPHLPYTKSSFNLRSQPHLGSAVNLDIDLEKAEFITMETIMEEDKEENNYSSPPRSPTSEFAGPPTFPVSSDTNHQPTVNNCESDSAVTTLKLPDFPHSRFLNMIMGSNKDLSGSTECVSSKEAPSFTAMPFFLKAPSSRTKLSGFPAPEQQQTDTLVLTHENSGTSDEHEVLIPAEMFPDKQSEMCTIKIPDLSILEEEVQYSRTSSPIEDSQHEILQMDVGSDCDSLLPSSPPYDSNSSQESLNSSSNQSTVGSYSELLKHAH